MQNILTNKNDYFFQNINKMDYSASQKDHPSQKIIGKISDMNDYTMGNTATKDNTNEMDIEDDRNVQVMGFDFINANNSNNENNRDDCFKDNIPQSCMVQINKFYGYQEGADNNFAKQLDLFEEKHNNIDNTEIKSKNKETEKNKENEMVIEKEKQNAEGEDNTQKMQDIFIVLIPQSQRVLSFNEAKNVIYNGCGSNLLESIKPLLISLGVSEILIVLTTNDKIGYSYESNRKFADRDIGDLIINSHHKNENESNKKAKGKRIKEILQKEMDDKTIVIKAINAIFNLRFNDFLYAFLEDESEIIIKNDYNDNNKTKVYFDKIEQSPCQPYYRVKFVTYKDCFNKKYPQELKQFYKEQITLLMRGKLQGRK